MIPTMASEAPADAVESLSAAEAYAIEHEPAAHSCPGCGCKTTANDVCADCSKTPCGLVGCVVCGDETTEGVCDICDPAPLLASLADAHVSPDVIRAAVEAERAEIAEMVEALIVRMDTPHDACAVEMLARGILARGRVTLG